MTENKSSSTRPKVTVYMPCHDYGHFLAEAVDSVVDQIFTDWELLIILDGAVDSSAAIAEQYRARDPDRVRLLHHEEKKGLQTCANLAIREARGDYIMRLDPDDVLDESALLVLSGYLNTHKDVALVYPNYFYMDEDGELLELDRRKKIGKEAKLLDLPAHGACTMIRKRVLKAVGGYNEEFDAQDGYDLWLKVVQRYPVGNVMTPLFHYRQHPASLTRNEDRILEARSRIKRHHSQNANGSVRPTVVGIVGAKTTYKDLPGIVLRELAGRPLIDYTLDAATEVGVFDFLVVSTDDDAVVEHCAKYPGVVPHLRDQDLSGEGAPIEKVIHDSVQFLEDERDCFADIVVFLNSHAPLKRGRHIQKAIDSLLVHNTDSVVSVYENFNLHYLHGKDGLIPLAKDRHRQLRIEREALYTDNRAILAVWREFVTPDDAKGGTVGHIIMSRDDSHHIKAPGDVWLLDQILERRNAETPDGTTEREGA